MNKMFKKIFAVVAACATVATMAVSAFAADITVAPADGAIKANGTVVDDATMYTVMVFSTTADITDAKAVAAATPADVSAIYYINQGTDVAALTANMLVKATDDATYLPAGNYVVRVGNDTGSVENFTLESKVASTGVQLTLNYGDVNGDGKVDNGDAGLILQKYANLINGFTDQEGRPVPNVVADVNGDNKVDNGDAGLVLQKYANLINGFTNQDGDALTTYTYTYTAPTE